MKIRKVDNKYLPEQIVEYLNRDIEDQEYAESLGMFVLNGLWVHYGGVCVSDVGRPVLDGGHREWSRRITETGGFVYKAFALKGNTLNM